MLGRAWFWNRIAKKYSRDTISDKAAYERKLASTAARLTPGSVVLELGCGTGTTAIFHAPSVAEIDAVDISPAMLEIGRTRAAEAGVSNIAFHEGTVEGFAGREGGYDMVMMHSVLHLVDDPAEALRLAAGHLAQGGWLVSSTAIIGEDGMNAIRLAMLPFSVLGLLPRLARFTSDELRAMHRAAGLEIVEDWKPGPKKALFLVARKT